MRNILAFLLIAAFCISLPPAANAANPNKLDFLLRFFDLNEAALAYHRHCLSQGESVNQNFINAMSRVTDNLYATTASSDPRLTHEQINGKILERRYKLQYQLDNANMKEGCQTKSSRVAEQHYRQLSGYSEADINRFIEQRTK